MLEELFKNVTKASKKLAFIEDSQINRILNHLADSIESDFELILSENKKDLDRMSPDSSQYDRLLLTKDRILGMAADIRQVMTLPSPLGRILKQEIRPNEMKLKKISVPFGVIGVIYESRPNVTLDVFCLCLKSGNACILKAGSEAKYSCQILVEIIQKSLASVGIDQNACVILPSDREATQELLTAKKNVDLLIPRGSQNLIQYVRENAEIPVIETGAGICHTYFDEFGDKENGRKIIANAKTRRVSVCNALDCLIVHESRLPDLPYLCEKLAEENVTLYADMFSYGILNNKYPSNLLQPAFEGCYGTEFLDYKMSILTVQNIDEAIEHISDHGSKHSECIISESEEHVVQFQKTVDAACVYANVSTAFTDGAQFGLGAEIGISTQKLHARGPMALEELTTYKWLIDGNGQIRNK